MDDLGFGDPLARKRHHVRQVADLLYFTTSDIKNREQYTRVKKLGSSHCQVGVSLPE